MALRSQTESANNPFGLPHDQFKTKIAEYLQTVKLSLDNKGEPAIRARLDKLAGWFALPNVVRAALTGKLDASFVSLADEVEVEKTISGLAAGNTATYPLHAELQRAKDGDIDVSASQSLESKTPKVTA